MRISDWSSDVCSSDLHVQEAVRTLLAWAGEDPSREGLLDTPARVGRAWKEYCRGYEEDPSAHLSRTFREVGGYDEIVLLKDIPFQSHCEHHLARSEEHTSELQSLMRISYAVFCLKKKKQTQTK